MGDTNLYICADGTLTYGPSGGLDKIIPQALPIAVLDSEDEANDLITLIGRKSYDVPEADPYFEQQLAGRTIQPGYGPTHRYYYAFVDFVRDDVDSLSSVRKTVAAMRARFRPAVAS